jgi:hypothetical protein
MAEWVVGTGRSPAEWLALTLNQRSEIAAATNRAAKRR